MVAALACRKRSPLKKRDREALLVSLSILLMAASFGLYTYNVMDSNRAGAAAQTVVNQLHSDMPAATKRKKSELLPCVGMGSDFLFMLGTFHIESLCQRHHPGGRRWRFFVLSHRKHQTLPVKKFPNTTMCLGKIKIWKDFNARHMFQFLLDGLSMVVGEVVRNHLAFLLEVYLTIGRGKAPFLSRIVRKSRLPGQ